MAVAEILFVFFIHVIVTQITHWRYIVDHCLQNRGERYRDIQYKNHVVHVSQKQTKNAMA